LQSFGRDGIFVYVVTTKQVGTTKKYKISCWQVVQQNVIILKSLLKRQSELW